MISSILMSKYKMFLDDSMTTPVRINDVTPSTFQLVLEWVILNNLLCLGKIVLMTTVLYLALTERIFFKYLWFIITRFVHLNEIVSPVTTVDEVIDLAIAAKKYEVNFLDQKCALLLEPFVTVSNVWNILDCLLYRGLRKTAEACIDVIVFWAAVFFLALIVCFDSRPFPTLHQTASTIHQLWKCQSRPSSLLSSNNILMSNLKRTLSISASIGPPKTQALRKFPLCDIVFYFKFRLFVPAEVQSSGKFNFSNWCTFNSETAPWRTGTQQVADLAPIFFVDTRDDYIV